MTTNEWRRALYAEFVEVGASAIDDQAEEHLRRILVLKRMGLQDREASRLLKVPTEYVRSLQATMR
jgi:hypothetical protein